MIIIMIIMIMIIITLRRCPFDRGVFSGSLVGERRLRVAGYAR